MKTLKRFGKVLGVLLIGLTAVTAFGQAGGPGGPGGGGPGGGGFGGGGGGGFGGGGGGGFDPTQLTQMIKDRVAQQQQQFMDDLKTQMGSSDDEFAALQPKIQAVLDDQQAAHPIKMQLNSMMGRGANSQGGQFTSIIMAALAPKSSEVEQALENLEKTLDDDAASPDAIRTGLLALRDARQKAMQTLAAAQDDLRGLVTAKQEAVLVANGILD